MDNVTLDGAGKLTPKQIISEHYRAMGKRSHAKVLERYGKEFYTRISRDYWAKKKADKTLEIKLG